MEEVTMAKRWVRGSEVRYFIETSDAGQVRRYTRYVTGNHWHPAKSWGTDNGETGIPSADVIAEYRRLTDGGHTSYFAPKPVRGTDSDDNADPSIVEPGQGNRPNNEEELMA